MPASKSTVTRQLALVQPDRTVPKGSRVVVLTDSSVGRLVPEARPVYWIDAGCEHLALRVTPTGTRTWFAFSRRGATLQRTQLGTWPTLSLAKARERAQQRSRRIVAMTARSIGNLPCEAQPVDWFDDACKGLALRVMPGGTRTWYAFYRRGRTARRVKLGTWPAVALSKARSLALHTRDRVETEHADPAYERKAERHAFTVGDVAQLYLKHAAEHKRTWKDDGWRLDRYILPAWRSRPVADIDRTDVHALLDKIVAAGTPIQANRVQALISKLMNFAIDRGHRTTNPCYRMGKPAPECTRATVLDDQAIRGVWAALDARPGDAADALRVRLLTGQRGGEVHSMRWADVDLEAAVWTIPSEHAKNRRAHRVPLSTPVLELLKRRREASPEDEARVFPGLYHQREDLREFSSVHAGTYRWHDLRRTVATRLAALGFPEETVGRVLNHARRGVTATVYNRHAYDAEKRAALDRWADEIGRLVTVAP